MNKNLIVKKIQKLVEKHLSGEATGHDWWHAWRAWKLAKKIAKKEGGDLFIIELAALLHDVEDWKFNNRKNSGVNLAKKWLTGLKINKKIVNHVCHIVKNISFKGADIENRIKTKEGKIVQDADRLDAVGAIGIARVFAYSGYAGKEIYNPRTKPKPHKTFREYRQAKNTAINHFYEKILLLKNRLNTKTAKEMAEKRHEFVKQFLNQFYKEWSI